MSVRLVRGKEAQELFRSTDFQANWKQLFEVCEWATVFQDIRFLRIWNEHYKEKHELILLYEFNEKGELVGLLPLTMCISASQLCFAGTYHSEYHTWLATRENGDLFIENALNLLAEHFPKGNLQFLFLAPNSPLEWLKKKWGKQSRLQIMQRPLVEIANGERAEVSLRKKSNKGKIKNLQRKGELQFIELLDSKDFAECFDEIEDFARLRMSGLHNVKPIVDPRRKAFHLDLIDNTDFVYPTLLKVGDEIASAQICIKNRDQMLLSITSMSPFFAGQSPSKLHLLLLEKELAKKGVATFDLSPGEGYKERFATHFDEVHTLHVFFYKAEFTKKRTIRRISRFSRKALETLKIRKTKAFAIADKLIHKLKRVKKRTIPATILKNIRIRIYQKRECRFYYFNVEDIRNLPDYDFVRRNSIEDLLKYKPSEGWQFTTSQFHHEVMNRFADGAISYTHAEGEKLLHYGWLLEHQEISRISEINNAQFKFPPNTAVLFDFYTNPECRGRKFYQKSLSQMLKVAAEIPGVKQVFIAVFADNVASKSVIEKLGFKYHSSLFQEIKFGRRKNW